MLQKVPELDFQNKTIKNKGKVSESQRINVCYETGKTGFMITRFFYHLNEIISKKSGDLAGRWDKLSQALDSNHGCMDMDLENEF